MVTNYDVASILSPPSLLSITSAIETYHSDILGGSLTAALEGSYLLNRIRLRFEVPLPRKFNDGADVPAKMLAEALSEIGYEFGGYQVQDIKGGWLHEGQIIGDDHSKLVVDAPDRDRSRRWMERFNERWRRLLKQEKLYMTIWRVEVLE